MVTHFFQKKFNTIFQYILVKIWIVLLLSCSKNNSVIQDVRKGKVEWAIGFPPNDTDEARDFSSELLRELNVSSIRINEQWRYREPEQGVYNWQPLDNRVNWAIENELEIFLTIQSSGPNWACAKTNENSCLYSEWESFQSYVEELVHRYPMGIANIQYGNEWQTEWWYIGTAEDFVRANNIVYQAVQLYNRDITVTLGGFSSTALAYLAGCGGKVESFYDHNSILIDSETLEEQCKTKQYKNAKGRIDYILSNAKYDQLDIHLYDDVGNWSEYFDYFQTMTTKPIIITEFGGPNLILEPDNEQYQANQLRKYMKEISKMDVSKAYYFKLVEGSKNPVHYKSGLIRASDLGKKKSFYVFKNFSNY